MQKIIGKWKRWSFVTELSTGPKESRSTVLTIEDEAVIAAFRKHAAASHLPTSDPDVAPGAPCPVN
jgi:hypothetical protein